MFEYIPSNTSPFALGIWKTLASAQSRIPQHMQFAEIPFIKKIHNKCNLVTDKCK